jgi:leucyl-tRNA synthetase
MEYNFREVEKKWQDFWAKGKTFKTSEDSEKPKYYVLDMFPYPSGAGLHVGHPLGYIASDIVARYKRITGFNVLHPMGFDSFGLPAEQYAIQTGQHPKITTRQNIDRYRDQMDKIGFSFDWDREIRTSEPDYYKWTQWIFIQIFHSWYNKQTNKAEPIDSLVELFETNGNAEVRAVCDDCKIFTASEWKNFSEKEQQEILMNYRLAYLSEAWVNWCPALGTVLANDEVKDGVSERGGYPVERKRMPQWSMRITAYADRLLNDLEGLDWTESIKEAQRNWIGKSEGTSLKFKVKKPSSEIEVFTTRPDTVFGVSFLTLAPEHDLVSKITTPDQKKAVDAYVTYSKSRSERERQADVKKITGQFTGAYALHPFTEKEIPIWIGDYVLAGYGTGAVMAVPAHDSRDYAFAKHFNLPIPEVVAGGDISKESYDAKEGKLINSGFLDGLEVKDAITRIIAEIESQELGKGKTNYRLRDAAFGRQRYWGEPIPVYYKDGIPYTMDEIDLPLELPEIESFLPTSNGEPPLARAKNWVYKPHEQNANAGKWPLFKTGNPETYPHLKGFSRDNRKNPTEAEEKLWEQVRGEKLNAKFRRQHVIENYIVDFVCLTKKLVIEIDGPYHDFQKDQDSNRELMIKVKGFRIIRFTNDEVLEHMDAVLKKITNALEHSAPPPAPPLGGGEKSSEQILPNGEDLGGAYPLETTTMPGWAGSSWYYLRYMDPHNSTEFASRKAMEYWKDVDLYIGGSEHATGHLLYVRFWTKFLKDLGLAPVNEPAKKLINQGMIQGSSCFVYRIDAINAFISSDLMEKYFDTLSNNGNHIQFLKQLLSQNNFSTTEIDAFKKKPTVSKLHADVNIVSNNELDIEKFKAWREEFKTAKFILEDGKYLCDSEVEKMSKSKHNVVSPDLICEQYGADCLRLYEMFLGPLEQSKPWNTNGITGVSNFIRKLWRLYHSGNGGETFFVSNEPATKPELKALHKTIKKVMDDIERYSFNTSVSNFMICVNELTDLKCHKRAILEPLAVLISPYAPHIAEELWSLLGHTVSITFSQFPEYDGKQVQETAFNYPVSLNGKTKFFLELDLSLSKEHIEKEVLANEQTLKMMDGKSPKKVIVVHNKIVNIVV